MLRRIPVCLMVAALAMSASMAAQTATGTKAATPAAKGATPTTKAGAAATAPKAGAAAPLTPADAAPLMGTWSIPLETPSGRLVSSLAFRTEAGKVVAGISAPQLPEQKITDITKRGNVVTLRVTQDYSGPLAAYSGPVTMVLTLTPKGTDYAAWFDFNSAAYQIGGTATKKK